MKNFFLSLCAFFFVFSPRLWAEPVAYSHLTDGYWQIWVMDDKGENKRQLTFSPLDKRDSAWMGEDEILYRTNMGQLFAVSLQDPTEKPVLAQFKNVNTPRVSLSNHTIVFARFQPQERDKSGIWVSELNGEHAVLLTKANQLVYQPVISPDGNWVVFVKADDNKKDHHLWIMDSSGANLSQLTFQKGYETEPAFSADQSFVGFSSNREGNYDIYLIHLKDKQIQQLTQDPGLDTHPCFLSKEEKIIFVSDRSGSQQIWSMDLKGDHLIQLTDDREESIDPASLIVGRPTQENP